jgi:hypothetical protein
MLDGIPNLAVPSESFDRIDIVHVSEEGRVYAPSTSGRLGPNVGRLLETWLNVPERRGLSLVRARESLVVPSPSITSASVCYRPREFEFEPGAYVPFESVDKESMNVGMRWPPEGSPATISPDAESLRRFPLKSVRGADIPEAVTSTSDRALRVFLEWVKPLDRLMGVLSGVDDINCQAQIAELARSSRANPKEALAKARRLAGPFLFDGHTTFELSWFRPGLAQRGIRHIVLSAEDKGLRLTKSLRARQWEDIRVEELLAMPEWKKVLSKSVPIRRVWGACGLFWALFLDRLEESRSFSSCERCGGLVSGKQGKRFCSAADDANCFKARRAADRRSLRIREQ